VGAQKVMVLEGMLSRVQLAVGAQKVMVLERQ